MAVGDADLGTGASLAMSTTFTAELTSIALENMTRVAVDKSHLGTSGAKSFLFGDQFDPGQLSLAFHHKTTERPPIDADAGAVTVTYPDASTWASTGGFIEAGHSVPMEEIMSGTGTVKLSGDVVVVDG